MDVFVTLMQTSTRILLCLLVDVQLARETEQCMKIRIRGLLIVVCWDETSVRNRAYKAISTCASSVTIVTLMQMRSELIVYTSTNTLLNPDPSHPLDPHPH